MKIFFVAKLHLLDWFFHIHEDGVEFLSDLNVRLVLLKSDEGEGVVCKAYYEAEVDDESYNFIDTLIYNNKYITLEDAPITVPFKNFAKVEIIDSNGFLKDGFSVYRNHLPKKIENLYMDIEELLRNTIHRFVSGIVWFQGIENQISFLDQISFYWKTRKEAKEFHLMPLSSHQFDLGMKKGLYWNSEYALKYKAFFNSSFHVPLGHELLREAKNTLETSPKSALMLLTSGLEVAVKQHIGKIAPQTDWILHNLPSPPIHKILKDYIVILHNSQLEVEQWKSLADLFKKVQKLIEVRNEIAHKGKLKDGEKLTKTDIEQYFPIVTNVLYILDVLAGEEWAKNHISNKYLKLLGWEKEDSKYDERDNISLRVIWNS
ncbi:hypothetical protein F959_00368 [Acinetobacter venetianus RAG-1 = CIP 110063]|uniref:Apea-like HEPN domain-containing protein n=2 Tax=Acinetobacter venetianus TaxID=52133 RepID=N8YPP3_ACIVR|nr:hypothetical protein [Acinetobacter venetianus]ENV38676.1 hypothetical protein F959_00368 [Acinetobacter venetianus RAG-1 = CIP 110063]